MARQTHHTTDPLTALTALIAAEGSQIAAARVLGIGQSYLSDLLNGRRLFSAKILDALGLERVVVQKRSA